MRPSSLRTEIQNLLDLLLEAQVAIYANPVVKRDHRGGMTRVTWGDPGGRNSNELFRGDFATLDEYHDWFRAEAYSAVLYDGSILQMSYDFQGDEFAGHRLAYYPCPFDMDEELLRIDPMLDVIELYRENEMPSVRLRSPLRFDCDMAAQREDHPAVHLTLLWSDCRWALVAPLSPGHFVRFLFKHFYPSLWSTLPSLREWPQRLGERTITPEQEGTLHVACSR
jgi:hypothetical protein